MGLQARIEKVLDVSIAREVEKLEGNLLVLATVASAGPFVGLFGTVWGIMTSFRSIAASKNTSLAVVAPGIAEALFATAIGLFAAIPALIAYNKLQGDVAPGAGAHGSLRRRVLVDPVPSDRQSCRPGQGGVMNVRAPIAASHLRSGAAGVIAMPGRQTQPRPSSAGRACITRVLEVSPWA